jgi:oligopeptide/dipeptide ABC transporter ATP-binding protein
MHESDPAVNGSPLLSVKGLTVEFPGRGRRQPFRAVDDVTLDVGHRETVGLVGESGAGKSTIGRAVLGLAPVTSGQIVFAGADITHARGAARRRLGRELQVVFQDPYSSLNPTRTVGQTIAESVLAHEKAEKAALEARVGSMLERVGLPADAARRYPSQFSGGQRQRIAIARALISGPKLVICDEPVTALDLSIQAQILNLLRNLQSEFALGYLFVAHDLSVVRHVAHRVIVLYRGTIVEQGPTEALYTNPRHPYTQALLDAMPVPDPRRQRERQERRRQRRAPVQGAPTSADACPFTGRCPHAIDICHAQRPAQEITPEGTRVACHRWRELGAQSQESAIALPR